MNMESQKIPQQKQDPRIIPATSSPESIQDQREENLPEDPGVKDDIRTKMGRAMGSDFSGVNLHISSREASSMGARAFTRNKEIHFAPGQYDESSREGLELIGHEFKHIDQQEKTAIRPSVQAAGLPVNADPSLEAEADQWGVSAAREVIQMKKYPDGGPLTINGPAEGIDRAQWVSNMRTAGSNAKGSISKKANKTLTAIKTHGDPDKVVLDNYRCIGAHMVPHRLGGKGDESNVRPWRKTFESGEWENHVEKPFKAMVEGLQTGKSITYEVETTDMEQSEATALSEMFGLSAEPTHVDNLMTIPHTVKANLNGQEKGPFICSPIDREKIPGKTPEQSLQLRQQYVQYTQQAQERERKRVEPARLVEVEKACKKAEQEEKQRLEKERKELNKQETIRKIKEKSLKRNEYHDIYKEKEAKKLTEEPDPSQEEGTKADLPKPETPLDKEKEEKQTGCPPCALPALIMGTLGLGGLALSKILGK